jgi:hypothetical protein
MVFAALFTFKSKENPQKSITSGWSVTPLRIYHKKVKNRTMIDRYRLSPILSGYQLLKSEISADNQKHDLGRSRIYCLYLGIPEETCNGIFLHVSVPSMKLNALPYDIV